MDIDKLLPSIVAKTQTGVLRWTLSTGGYETTVDGVERQADQAVPAMAILVLSTQGTLAARLDAIPVVGGDDVDADDSDGRTVVLTISGAYDGRNVEPSQWRGAHIAELYNVVRGLAAAEARDRGMHFAVWLERALA